MVSTKCLTCLAIFSIILAMACISIGIVGLTIGPDILQNQIAKQLPFTVDSDQLSSWESPPVPIYLQFWLWECVNVGEVMKGDTPRLRQVGPFTYSEHRQKRNIVFYENHTVSYRQDVSYKFLRDKSFESENFKVTMINAFAVTLVTLVQTQRPYLQELLNIVTNHFNDTLFAEHTVGEWLWGYEDPILKALKNNPLFADLVPDDKFGLFYGQNATDDGLYTVHTGEGNIDLINIIDKWNGVSDLTYWPKPYASQINGTDGSWFPPLYKKDLSSQRLYLYSTDVCRSLYAKWSSHSTTVGIPTERFAIPSELFLNSSVNPDNEPFGLNVSGVFDVSRCRQKAPIYISFPHFLYADDSIRNGVSGLVPDELAHRVTFDIEPHTGLVLSAQKRLQINVRAQANTYMRDFRNIKTVIMPALWINESTTIDQASANDLNSQVLNFFSIVNGVSIGLIAFGGFLVLLTIVIYIFRRNSPYSSSNYHVFSDRQSIADDIND